MNETFAFTCGEARRKTRRRVRSLTPTCGVAQTAAREPHKLKVVGSSPTPASNFNDRVPQEEVGAFIPFDAEVKHAQSRFDSGPVTTFNNKTRMSLLDLVEMFCDWKAATERHADGCLEQSIEFNRTRFKMSDQLVSVFENTRKEMGW